MSTKPLWYRTAQGRKWHLAAPVDFWCSARSAMIRKQSDIAWNGSAPPDWDAQCQSCLLARARAARVGAK